LSYNLLEEEWIPVLYTDGKFTHVGIKGAFREANRIRQIAASNPMDCVAIFRFMLALLYWCQGNPPVATDIASERLFPLDRFTKLDANRECFNLLGGGTRFYQYRQAGDKELTVNYLLHEIPTGTNFWHFRHSTDNKDGLCRACCALGLVRLPVFSTQGGRGNPPGINAKPPMYVVPIGNTLADALLLSWWPVSGLGSPAWEKPDLPLPKAGQVPLLTGLTWLPRRVWLGEPQETVARCISCGRQDHLILSSVFAGKGSTKTGDNTPQRIWHDPHVIYVQSRMGEISLHANDSVSKVDVSAGQWAGTMAELLRNPQNGQVKAWVVGFSTDQAKCREVSESFFPWAGSPEQVELCIEMLNQWQQLNLNISNELKGLDGRIFSAKRPEIKAMMATVRPHIESRVSQQAAHFLTGGDSAWQQAKEEYSQMMKVVAGALSPGVTTEAVGRRRKMARLLPEMVRQTAKPGEPVRVKRGSK